MQIRRDRIVELIALVGMAELVVGCGQPSVTHVPSTKAAKENTPKETENDEEIAQGTWLITKIEGPQGTPQQQDESFKSLVITVRGKLISVRRPGGNFPPGHEGLYFTFSLESSKLPKQVDLIETDEKGNSEDSPGHIPTGLGKVFMGIYKLDSDNLVIAFPAKPGMRRATEFKGFATPDRSYGVGLIYLKKK